MVQRITLFLITLLIMTATVSAATWKADVAHSSVNFAVKHLVISTINGKFDKFESTLDWDGQDLTTGKVDFTIQMNSVDTDNSNRDEHLISPDFFNADKYPTMSFKSSKVIVLDSKSFKLEGELTILGVTKTVIFDCEYHGTANFMKTTKSGFSARAEINRQYFGITWSKALDGGGLVVSDKVKISLELEYNKSE